MSHMTRPRPGAAGVRAPTVVTIPDLMSTDPRHHSSLSGLADYTHRPGSPLPCWALQNHQRSNIRALECSPSGKWLLSAADDATVLFIDFHSGWTIARLALDNTNGRFKVLSGAWCSEAVVLCGGSNGFIYVMEFNPQNDLHPISLREILSPMPEQVVPMVLNASQTYLGLATLL